MNPLDLPEIDQELLARRMIEDEHPIHQWAVFLDFTGLPWGGALADDADSANTMKVFSAFCRKWEPRIQCPRPS